MKNILLIFIGLALFGCGGHGELDENGYAKTYEDTDGVTRSETYNKTHFHIIELDNCEYIMTFRAMTHKGDCKNKIHEHNK